MPLVVLIKWTIFHGQVKRTGLMLVAYRSHPDETKAMRNAFNWYDVDRNGRVGRAEFQEVLKQQGYTNEEVRTRRLPSESGDTLGRAPRFYCWVCTTRTSGCVRGYTGLEK